MSLMRLRSNKYSLDFSFIIRCETTVTVQGQAATDSSVCLEI